MEEEISMYLDEAKSEMEKAVEHTKLEFGKIRAGKPTTNMFADLSVDYYGSQTPLNQIANISIPDAKTVVIKPWEKNMVGEIVKVLRESDLGFNPIAETDFVRINVPPLSGERRQEFVKRAKNEAEEGKIRIRNARKDANNGLRAIKGAPEDMVKDAEDEVQNLTDKYSKQVDELLVIKEKDITTV